MERFIGCTFFLLLAFLLMLTGCGCQITADDCSGLRGDQDAYNSCLRRDIKQCILHGKVQ